MYLYINTTENDSFTIAVFDKKRIIKKKKVKSQKKHSEKLLKSIDSLLSGAEIKLSQIIGIAVAQGPGPFTSLRIGIATANALAFALGIKIAAINKSQNLKDLPDCFEKILKSSKSKIVLPKYDDIKWQKIN